jgi:SAM-dependent methyltransferase
MGQKRMADTTGRVVTDIDTSMAPGTPALAAAPGNACRFCGTPLRHTFVDLGMSPLCESYLSAGQLNQMEPFYPLHVFVCEKCFLVQLQEYVSVESIFEEYAYFSSYSESWLAHAKTYTERMIERFALGSNSHVVEVASNDGYLLQYFVAAGIPVLGIEPAANVAAAAVKRGIPTLVKFFNRESAAELAAEGKSADLLLGNNVLAQVPDVNSFVAGLKVLLKPNGVITMEFPHLTRLMEESQFDTIYHEHFSYFSLLSTEKILAAAGLVLFDVEELPTHGGSLRIYACHKEDRTKSVSPSVLCLRAKEEASGLSRLESYSSFAERVKDTKCALLEFLIGIRRAGKQVVGYGAPGKGNTLLNYCGIRSDLLSYTVDRNPYKQGKYLPGSHIPIHSPERIGETRPDYVLILPWNLKDEIMQQLAYIRGWGGKFVVPIPLAKICA